MWRCVVVDVDQSKRKADDTDTPGTIPDPKDLEMHIRVLRRYAHALLGDPTDADDLVQETLKRALTYIDGKKEIRNLRSYLLTILHNVRIDQVRSERHAGHHVPLDEAMMIAEPAAQPSRLEYRKMLVALSLLPEDQRAVLLLAGLEGRKYREVAEILDQPIGTVMSRLSRARQALRRQYEGGERAAPRKAQRAKVRPPEPVDEVRAVRRHPA